MAYLFTSESVSEGHPDKIADQISDALIDNFLAFDADSKVACETLVTTGQVILAGEVKSNTYLDVQQIARDVIKKIGYTKSEYMFEANSCGILSAIHEQSADINQGVDRANPNTSTLYSETHPSVLSLIKKTIETCKKHGVKTSIFGEGPSNLPELVEKLVEFGIDSISVEPDAIQTVQSAILRAEKRLLLDKIRNSTQQ